MERWIDFRLTPREADGSDWAYETMVSDITRAIDDSQPKTPSGADSSTFACPAGGIPIRSGGDSFFIGLTT